MSREINDLIGPFQTGIRVLIKRANDAGIPAFVTDTKRTKVEQRRLVDAKLSWTMDSLHLTGEAADIAFLVDGMLSYDRNLYFELYEIAKEIPFVIWPYNDLGWNWDFPHFQYDTDKGIIDDMNKELEAELREEIRKLNEEIGVITPQRDAYKDQLEEEVKLKQEMYDNWQDCLDQPTCIDEKQILKQIHESTKDYA